MSISYFDDWNLVGLPLEVVANDYQTLFPNAIENTLYSFIDQTYTVVDTLNHGKGYWLRFDTAGTSTITGAPINELIVSLNEGWNLISGLHENISIYLFNDPDSIIVPNTLFGFSDAYFPTEELIPGKGYWLRAFQDGEITLTSNANGRIVPHEFSLKDKVNTLSINGMDLYFGLEFSFSERLSYSLPPKPPMGAFDARFSGDWVYPVESNIIEVMHSQESLRIDYNIRLEGQWILVNNETDKTYELTGSNGSMYIHPAETFRLDKIDSAIPSEFSLFQNFPNPFNPVTAIKYDIPTMSFTKLVVYDISGKIVKVLDARLYPAGSYSIIWDGKDQSGQQVSSGVYFYSIENDQFRNIKKMLLVK